MDAAANSADEEVGGNMDQEQEERLVLAWEGISTALKGIRDELRRAGNRFWPQPKEQKQAVVSRVESDAEREQKLQGSRRRTVQEVVDPNAEENPDEWIGERTRQWLRDHAPEVGDASSKAKQDSGAGAGGGQET